VTEAHVRGAINFFKKEGMIEVKATRLASIISIVNWAKYQTDSAPKNTQKSNQAIPQAINQAAKDANPSAGAAYSEYEEEPLTKQLTKQLTTKQELHTLKISSSNSFVSSDDDTTEVKTPKAIAKKSSPDYPKEFEWIWANRPRRSGSDPKAKAFSACNARLKQNHTWREMAEGMKRYTAYCEAEGSLDTSFTMMMATFFGKDKHFTNDYKITVKAKPSFCRTPAELDHNSTDWVDLLNDGDML
jgi:hypothetical protein